MKWVYSRLHGHIFVSGALRDSVTRYLPGEFRVIPNGVDCRHFASPEIQKIAEFDDGRPNILFVGRLDERKGYRTLLGAFEQVHARVPAARLLVVGAFGEGEASQFAEQIPTDLRQDVHLIGRVSREALPRYYRSATLFCAPSTGGESFGIVLLEAMAASAPVVASDIPGYRSVIENARQGCLVPPGDKEALACSLIQLLQDAGRRAEMAAEGQATAERYDWKLVAPRVLDYYEDLISRRTAIEADRPHARGASRNYRANGLNDFHGRVWEWVKRYIPFTRSTLKQSNSPRAAR
jgi:phosphatidylinositol alpha-mannosyltransferase